MRPAPALAALALVGAAAVDALTGDLNRDGKVDYEDFFLFSDQFGRTDAPASLDTVVVVRVDTFRIAVHDTLTVRDTLVVRDTLTVRDTVYVDPADTVTRTGTPIAFGDPALEFAVRARVGVDEGDVLTGDVVAISTLDLSGRHISVLEGLQSFPALRTLALGDNRIVDLSPLSGLTTLRSLSLASNQVRDLAPLLANPAIASGATVVLVENPLSVNARTVQVPSLQDRGAAVSVDAFTVTFEDSLLEVAVRGALQQPEDDLLSLDLETVATLDASGDSVASLSGLQFARYLVDLDLADNAFTSISALSSLKRLEVLDLRGNALGSASALAGLTALRELDLGGTGIVSVAPLSGLTKLEVLSLNVNQISSIAALSGLTALRRLNLRDNAIADLSVLLGLPALTDVWLEGNPLNAEARDAVIPALVDRQVFVRF